MKSSKMIAANDELSIVLVIEFENIYTSIKDIILRSFLNMIEMYCRYIIAERKKNVQFEGMLT